MATPIPQNSAEFEVGEICGIVSGKVVSGDLSGLVRGVSTDSREDLRGKAFVALVGEKFDGHAYLGIAAEAGARVLVVSKVQPVNIPQGVTVIEVADTLVALGQLAAHHRSRWSGRLIAVVGSAGKTTTRSVISSLLAEHFPGAVHSTTGNLNNRIGVPMVLFGLTEDHRYAALELGTNQKGEIALLARMVRPHVAVLTLIDLEHTDGLGDLDGVEQEEGAVFQHLEHEGTAVGWGDDKRVRRCLAGSGAAMKTYGFDAGHNLTIVARELIDTNAHRITLRRESGDEFSLTSSLVGRPGSLAVAAAVTGVESLIGDFVDISICERALRSAGEPGRNQVIHLPGGPIVVDDSYNSNPASVESSIVTGKELSELSGGRLWLVLGEMLELGAQSIEAHRQMGHEAIRSGAAGVFFVQGDARMSADVASGKLESHFFEDASGVAPVLAPLLAPADVVVVKASRGVRAERVVQGLKAFYKHVPKAAPTEKPEGGGSSP